jgi:hypothetical protein
MRIFVTMDDAFVTLTGDCYLNVLYNNVVMPTDLNQRISEVAEGNITIKLLILYRHLTSGTHYCVLTLP